MASRGSTERSRSFRRPTAASAARQAATTAGSRLGAPALRRHGRSAETLRDRPSRSSSSVSARGAVSESEEELAQGHVGRARLADVDWEKWAREALREAAVGVTADELRECREKVGRGVAPQIPSELGEATRSSRVRWPVKRPAKMIPTH